MEEGLLITVEGIDGAGKHTLCSLIKKFLESKNIEVIQMEYPDYSSIWGKMINDYLHNKIEFSNNEQFFLYLIDILKDQDKIRRLLKMGSVVISDRYFSSTVAFQCAKSFNYQQALSIIKAVNIIVPDLTLFIQIPPEVTLKRKIKQKGSIDRHEKNIELLRNVNGVYEKMLKEEILSKKWVKIDGNQDLSLIENDAKYIIKKFLGGI